MSLWIGPAILWAPIAAVVCMRQARARGYNIRYYGLVGVLYSALLLLPWIYLALRLSGRSVHISLILTGYFIAYMVCSLNLYLAYSFLVIDRETEALASSVLSVGVALIVASAVALIWTSNRSQWESQPYEHRLRDFVYVAPFALTVALSVVLQLSLHNRIIIDPVSAFRFVFDI